MTLTEKDLTQFEDALRREHHSEFRWTNTACAVLIAEVRVQRERIAALENAIRKVIKHQPWPGDDRSERDFNAAALLVPEEF